MQAGWATCCGGSGTVVLTIQSRPQGEERGVRRVQRKCCRGSRKENSNGAKKQRPGGQEERGAVEWRRMRRRSRGRGQDGAQKAAEGAWANSQEGEGVREA